jgi:hypothetical protein
VAPPDPFDIAFERFTDAELQSWFDDKVAGTDEFNGTLELISAMRQRSSERVPELDGALEDGARALLDNQGITQGIASSFGPRDMIKRVDWSAAFARLGRESKLKLLQGWVRQYPAELVFLRDPADIDVEFIPDPDSDPEWQSPDFKTISLPDGTQVLESDAVGADYIPTDYVIPPDPEPSPTPTPNSNSFDLSKWKVRIGIGGVLGLILVLGLVFATGGGHDTDASDDAAGELGNSSANQEPAATTPTGAENPCDAIRGQKIVLELSSPDVQPTIPLAHGRGGNDFLAPALKWSTVPDGTVEIAVSVQEVTGERAEKYAADPLLWWRGESTNEPGSGGVPIGSPKWLVTGIDPSASGLPRSSQTIPLPEGALERSVGGTQATFNGVTSDSMFIGPGLPGERFLFSVFALCDSTAEVTDNLSAGFLGRSSIATGWFISEYAP